MTYNELLEQIKEDHQKLMIKAHQKMRVWSCFHLYAFHYKGRHYKIEINLLTLDFTPKSKMPVSLRSKIKSRMIKEEYLKWKFKKEGRAFFDFLKLNFTDVNSILFTDCESPDFIIHNHLHHGYEVVEATDAHNAKFNEALYLLTGMENTTKEFEVYIEHIEKTLMNKRKNVVSVKPRAKHESLHDRILKCITKKAIKYNEYEVDLDTKNIIVFNNRIGFRRDSDFQHIGKMIENEPIIFNSDLDRIFIISGTHDVMVEYNRYGDIKKICRKTK